MDASSVALPRNQSYRRVNDMTDDTQATLDRFKDYNLQPVEGQQSAAPASPAPATPSASPGLPPAIAERFKGYNLTPVVPDVSSGQPAPFNSRLGIGAHLSSVLGQTGEPAAGPGMKDTGEGQSWLSKAWDAVRPPEWHMPSALGDEAGMASQWAQASTAEGARAREQVAGGLSEIADNKPATGVGDIAWGAAGAVWAPFQALWDVAGSKAEKVTGNPDFGEKVAFAGQFLTGTPVEGRAALALRHLDSLGGPEPGVIMKDGSFARLIHDPETNTVHPQVVGRAPNVIDFKKAAEDIATANGHTDPAVKANIQQHVQNAWTLQGYHPAEVVERARQSEAVAHALSSDVAANVPISSNLDRRFMESADDTLHMLKTKGEARDENFLHFIASLPEELRQKLPEAVETNLFKLQEDLPMKERILRYMEGDPTHGMTPEDMKFYNDTIAPMRDLESELYQFLSETDLPRTYEMAGQDFEVNHDPTYLHKMRIGKTPGIDQYTGNEGDDPLYSGRGPSITNTHPGSLEHANYWTFENQAGERRLVRITNDGRTAHFINKEKPWEVKLDAKGTPTSVMSVEHPEGKKFRKGDVVTDKEGNTWELKNAWHREVESQTPVRYYHEPLMSLVDNIRAMQAAKEALYTIQNLKDTPQFQANAVTRGQPHPPDWDTPDLPMLQGYVMHPKLKALFDNFYSKQSKDHVWKALAQGNRAAIGSLFLTPVPHFFNEAAYTFSRYFAKPTRWAPLVKHSFDAFSDVANRTGDYLKLQENGASLHYGPTINSQEGGFYARMLRHFGHAIEEPSIFPEGWEGIAEALGEKPADVIKAWYRASSRALWMATDVMHVGMMKERIAKGMTPDDAARWVERWAPRYRTPPQLFGNTYLRGIYFNNLAFEFSRYHYDIYRGYANMIRDLVKGTGGGRLDAMGTLMGVAALQLMVYPAMQGLVQQIPGLEDTTVPSFGPGKLAGPIVGAALAHTDAPALVKDYYKDRRGGFWNTMSSFFPVSPAMRLFGGVILNHGRDIFTDKNVTEPGETSLVKQAAQATDWTAQQLVEPYHMAAEAWRHGLDTPQVLAQVALGFPTLTKEERETREYFDYKNWKKAQWRNPVGPIEGLVK